MVDYSTAHPRIALFKKVKATDKPASEFALDEVSWQSDSEYFLVLDYSEKYPLSLSSESRE